MKKNLFKSFPYLIRAKIIIITKKTIKMKKRTFRIPQPVLPAPLKPKIPEKIINTAAIIARIQKILILYFFQIMQIVFVIHYDIMIELRCLIYS